MADPRWEPDTLFLVAEEDFRFEDPTGLSGTSSSAGATPPRMRVRAEPAAAQDLRPGQRAEGQWYTIPAQAPASAFQHPTDELCDLVAMCGQAHRAGRGHVIWLCWQPGGAGYKPARTGSIKSGAMLMAVSHHGAQQLAAGVRSGEIGKGHWDVHLLRYLQAHQRSLGASYVQPPVGNYTTHQSGCDMSLMTGVGRLSCWDEKWCVPGTRPAHDSKRRQRWICGFAKTGPPEWLQAVTDPDVSPHSMWRSFWVYPDVPPPPPPGGPSAGADTVGPPPPPRGPPILSDPQHGSGASSSGAGAARPDEPAASAAQPPGSHGARPDAESGPTTGRQKRQRRQQKRQLTFRHWVEEEREAVRFKSDTNF